MTQPLPQAGVWGLEDNVGCGERCPHPFSGPARLLSFPRPPRDEILGTSLVTIVTLRPSLSGLATEEGTANKKLWAVWGGPHHGVGGGQEVRGEKAERGPPRRDACYGAGASAPLCRDISGEHPRTGARFPPF